MTPAPLARDAADVGIPCLVVEVLSPSTRHRDRRQKLRHYLEAGVAEVWFVDPDEETIEIRTSRGGASFRGDEVARSEVVEGLRVSPGELLA